MKNKYFKKGIFSAVAIVVILIAAIAANIFVTSKDYSVDVTDNKIYTLSKQTESILDSLDQTVTIYIINKESGVNATYARVFKQYGKASAKITLEYKDPDLYPNFTKDYVSDSDSVSADSVIVVSGDKSRYISSDDYVSYSYGSDYSYSADSLDLESLLTEAINYVISDETPKVYTLSGHSEQNLTSDIISNFEGDNYAVETLNLLSAGSVPDDCEILLINGAQKDLTKDELKQIKKYMKNGGKMYVFLDAGVEDLENLYALMETYNIGVDEGVVVETDSSMYTQYPIYLLPNIESSEVTADQYNSNIYILTPSVKGLKDLSAAEEEDSEEAAAESTNAESTDTAEDTESTYTITPLLTTSDKAYSKVDTTSSTMEKEDGDIEGPFDVSIAVSDETGGRMIVTGCTNMLVDSIDAAVGGANTDFVLNGINYLAKQESKISIRAKDLTTENAVVPQFNQKMTLILTVFVIPVVILFFGIVMIVRRRRL